MKYMGSKNRIAKFIVPILEKNRGVNQWYIEPFVGGANMIDKMSGNRAGFDSNEYLIEMFKAFLSGWEAPDYVSEEIHKDVKINPEKYEKHFIAFVRFGCSFGADWNGGFARNVKKDSPLSHLNKTTKSYCRQSKNNILKQVKNLKDVHFETKNFQDLKLFEPCLIYCDPPYEGTTKYKDDFPHDYFWEWVRNMVKDGHKVFISEYKAPDDFVCVWNMALNNNLNNFNSETKKPTEKLFIHESQFNNFIE